MQKNQGWYTTSNDDGVKKVLNENYAFFMESTSIEWVLQYYSSNYENLKWFNIINEYVSSVHNIIVDRHISI